MIRHGAGFALGFARAHWWFRQVLLAVFVAGFIFGRAWQEQRREAMVWAGLASEARAYATAQLRGLPDVLPASP